MPLTDTACKKAVCPPDKARVRLTDSGGLYLEVVPSGSKLWRWKYRFEGAERRMALGAYPAVSIAAARVARDEAREVLNRGVDPVTARAHEHAHRVIGTARAVVGMAQSLSGFAQNLSSMPAPLAGSGGIRVSLIVPDHLKATVSRSKDGRTINVRIDAKDK